jgi:nucleotide-binding universal stress UspA family protein
MSYAALMVHVGTEQDLRGRVRLAAELVDRFDCALIGVAGWLAVPTLGLDDHAVNELVKDTEGRKMRALLSELGTKFRASVKHLRHVEWRGVVDYPRDLVPREARAADLLVIGRERVPGDPYFSLNPGATIIRAGRPVLAVPDQVDSLAGRRVVVAWKDTRESRRALRDALPFLQNAEEVMIVEVSEGGQEQQSRTNVDDVANYLLRHKVIVGLKAQLQTRQAIASEILSVVRDENADLIVAGGYGHSRLGEWIFGGVTRDLLAKSPVCCLFSH